MLWIFVLLFLLLATIGGFVFVVWRIANFKIFEKFGSKKRVMFITTFAMCLCFAVLVLITGLWNAMVYLIHLLIFWLLSDGLFWLFGRRKDKRKRSFFAGITAISITIIYIGVGTFLAFYVYRTEYKVTTDNLNNNFKIVGFSDSHTGTTFAGKDFSKYVKRMNNENADIAVIVGDFVDDDTSREDMVSACKELKNLKTNYGTYFVFGNHDAGYYNNSRRGYSRDDLITELKKNNVTVLEDECINIIDNIFLIGRKDAEQKDRKSVESLTVDIPENACKIVLDHQPKEYENEVAAKVTLVLSGHTHGGQLIPINYVGEWFDINDMTYGMKKINNTNFIVSSGISDWAFKIKTGCISEYFVINVAKE